MLHSVSLTTEGVDEDQVRASLRQSSLKNSVVAWLLVEGRLPDQLQRPATTFAHHPPPVDLSNKQMHIVNIIMLLLRHHQSPR